MTFYFLLSTFYFLLTTNLSYHLYHTPALVLGSEPFGEGSKRFTLFTRELGAVVASARSVREERSKLRYGLQELSLSEVTLVRGREQWRVTNAALSENLFGALRGNRAALEVCVRISRLLRRLLAGEEKHEALFDTVIAGFRFLETLPDANLHRGSEIVLVLRILFLLGYLAPRCEFDALLSSPAFWDEKTVSRALSFRALAILEINHSLRQTQL